MTKSNRPSFGRSQAERGLDQFDTPSAALAPVFVHEPLLANVTSACEPFSGRGNLVTTMRLYGLTVHASDIEDRGCPYSEVFDFFTMTCRPSDCDLLLSNPPYSKAIEIIEHALTLEFRIIVLLLKTRFLNTEERYTRLHPLGHLRRVHVFAERLQDMHDAKYLQAGGKKASQSEDHGWFVFDRNFCGKPELNFVSIKTPTARMPWANVGNITAEAAE